MRQPLPQCDCDHRDDDCDDACDDACDYDWDGDSCDGDEEHCLSPVSVESFNINIITVIIVIIAIVTILFITLIMHL